MKKLLKDECLKTAFTFNDEIHKHIGVVLVGSPFRPFLTNVFMTELGDIIEKIINEKFFKFYIWYVDDTLLLVED